jgi:hypothetical protein
MVWTFKGLSINSDYYRLAYSYTFLVKALDSYKGQNSPLWCPPVFPDYEEVV